MPWLTHNIAPTYFVFVCERVYYSLSDTLTDSLEGALATQKEHIALGGFSGPASFDLSQWN